MNSLSSLALRLTCYFARRELDETRQGICARKAGSQGPAAAAVLGYALRGPNQDNPALTSLRRSVLDTARLPKATAHRHFDLWKIVPIVKSSLCDIFSPDSCSYSCSRVACWLRSIICSCHHLLRTNLFIPRPNRPAK